MLNKKVLAVAVIGGLFAAGNAAAVELTSSNGTVEKPSAAAAKPVVFAKEITIGNNGKVLTTNNVAPISWKIGYNFSQGEVRYVRLEAPAGFKFGANIGELTIDGGQVGSVNGVGTNVLYFSVTATAAAGISKDAVITYVADHTVTSHDAVNLVASLYDQPSQAQNGGENGKIVNATASGAYISFARSYALTSTPSAATADVEVLPTPFSQFTSGKTATLGQLKLALVDTDSNTSGVQPTLDATGAAISFAKLFSKASVIVEGDFSAAADSAGKYGTAAAGSLNWDGNSTLTASKATFNLDSALPTFVDRSAGVRYTVVGKNAIPAGDYTASLAVTAATGYTVENITGVKVGSINRNGTTLQAPLMQIPAGWLTRLALTNTGSMARPYTISVMTEEGATFEINADKLSGEIPAGGTKVVELTGADLAEKSGLRGTVQVTVSGPKHQIEGLYQIVNPNNGLVNNHVLVKEGGNGSL